VVYFQGGYGPHLQSHNLAHCQKVSSTLSLDINIEAKMWNLLFQFLFNYLVSEKIRTDMG